MDDSTTPSRGVSPRTFNRACAAVALLWLVVAVPASVGLRPRNFQDFSHFYLGGLVARHGLWDDLYPIPHAHSANQASAPEGSAPRAGYAALARTHGVDADRNGDGLPDEYFRFAQPPPNALLYLPLAYLPYERAHDAWIVASGLCAWVIALQAACVLRRILGRDTRAAGLLVLLIALAPNTYQSIRVSNVSALTGALVGVALVNLVGRDGAWGGLAIAVSMVGKYATGVLIPLEVAMRRWRTVLWTGIFLVAIVGVSVAVMGTGPWEVFGRDILPTLNRPHYWRGNQSLEGVLIHLTGSTPENPLPKAIERTCRMAGAVAFVAVLALIFTRRRETWGDPARVFAAAALLMAWMHVFSPIFWNHYYFYLYPLWGWLAWEALTQSVPRRIAAALAIVLALVPLAVVPRIEVPAALAGHMLWSALIVAVLAVARLVSPAGTPMSSTVLATVAR